MPTNETKFWQQQAALLDPLAWSWTYGNWTSTITVPVDETWFTTNMYQCALNGSDAKSGFLRKLDVRQALALPSGTTIDPPTSPRVYMGIMLCKPEVVIGNDSRYTTDPKALYYDRIIGLQSLEVKEARVEFTAGGDNFRIGTDMLPDTFDYGMVVGVSCYDVAWVELSGTPSSVEGPNTQSEINNCHSQRFASSLLQPFDRATFDRIQVQSANIWGRNTNGTPEEPGEIGTNYTVEGNGALFYVVLPENW